MEPRKPTPIPDSEGGPEGEDPAMEPNRPNADPDDERRPKDDKPGRRKGGEQEDLPQADGDSTDPGDASVEDAAKDAGLK